MNNLSDHLTGPKLWQQQMLHYAYSPPPIFPQVKPNALVSTFKMNVERGVIGSFIVPLPSAYLLNLVSLLFSTIL